MEDGSGAGPAAAAVAAPAPTDLSSADVLTKKKEAAAVANQVLKGVLTQLAPGKLVADVCEFGDALIAQLTAPMYKSKKIEKGVAFPTCVSVNECVGHYSPFKTESKSLAEGDVVKMCVARAAGHEGGARASLLQRRRRSRCRNAQRDVVTTPCVPRAASQPQRVRYLLPPFLTRQRTTTTPAVTLACTSTAK